jgi:ATP-dependent DNA helicase 2 subunit 1
MLNKIVSSDRDLVGVILFGTNKTSNVLNVPHVVVLQELQELNAEKIKQLLNMLKRKLLCLLQCQQKENDVAVGRLFVL